MASLVRKGVPLPLGGASAKRAYLSRRNLADLILAMVQAGDQQWSDAAGKTCEPSDGVGLATRHLVVAMAACMGKPARLIAVPVALLRIVGSVTGKTELVSGAIEPLDSAPVADLDAAFGWKPVEQLPESLSYLGASPTSS